jgi:hypothetical protein
VEPVPDADDALPRELGVAGSDVEVIGMNHSRLAPKPARPLRRRSHSSPSLDRPGAGAPGTNERPTWRSNRT